MLRTSACVRKWSIIDRLACRPRVPLCCRRDVLPGRVAERLPGPTGFQGELRGGCFFSLPPPSFSQPAPLLAAALSLSRLAASAAALRGIRHSSKAAGTVGPTEPADMAWRFPRQCSVLGAPRADNTLLTLCSWVRCCWCCTATPTRWCRYATPTRRPNCRHRAPMHKVAGSERPAANSGRAMHVTHYKGDRRTIATLCRAQELGHAETHGNASTTRRNRMPGNWSGVSWARSSMPGEGSRGATTR